MLDKMTEVEIGCAAYNTPDKDASRLKACRDRLFKDRFMARTLDEEGACHDPDQERLGASFVRQDVSRKCLNINKVILLKCI